MTGGRPACHAVIQPDGDSGWWMGWVEGLPGANTQGRTPEEAVVMLLDAVREILAARRELGISSDGR